MKLKALNPKLVHYRREDDGRTRLPRVSSLADAQGVLFGCPQCSGPAAHSILVWFRDRGVPAEASPTPRWAVAGTSLADLTLSPSINVPSCWHGFITDGEVTSC